MSELIKIDYTKQTYMTVKQIAELCNVTSKTILEWIKNTPLHFVKVENGIESHFNLEEVLDILRAGKVSEILISTLLTASKVNLLFEVIEKQNNSIVSLQNECREIRLFLNPPEYDYIEVIDRNQYFTFFKSKYYIENAKFFYDSIKKERGVFISELKAWKLQNKIFDRIVSDLDFSLKVLLKGN